MSHIDTAQMYGKAERIMGQAIAGLRDHAVRLSKVVPDNASRGIANARKASLKRLRTDRFKSLFD